MNADVDLAAAWRDLEARLRPFVARRVASPDVDDVVHDVFVRMRRGLGGLRDDDRLVAWMFQTARSAIADHGRDRARHPLAGADPAEPAAPAPSGPDADAPVQVLAACLRGFVERLPSPYREAVTLVELDGLTAREAADLAGVSVSGMKSRVQRGRAQLRGMLDACCAIALDARGHVTDVVPRAPCC